MPRIPLPAASDIPDELRDYVAQLPADAALGMISHATGTAAQFIGLGQKMFTSLALPAPSREIAILTTARTTDCDFVLTQHTPIATAVGVSEAARTAITEADWDSDALAPNERALIAISREVITRPRVTDATFDAARTFLSPRMIVELIQVCGFYFTFGRICTALDLDVSVHGPGVLNQITAMRGT